MATRKILIFEDVPGHLNKMAEALQRDVSGIQIDWTPSLSRVPQRWEAPLQNLEGVSMNSHANWRPILKAYAQDYSIVIVDLELNDTDCDCDACLCGFPGLHALRELAKASGLHRAFVSTSQVPNVASTSAKLAAELSGFLVNGASLFHKPVDDDEFRIPDLLDKISAWLRFEELGYQADHSVRDQLYLVGRRGLQKRPEHVLILGESGTGKERAAKFIHEFGGGGPFRTVLCGSLLEGSFARSELFGHVKGAYTGALSHRAGVLLTALGFSPPARPERINKTDVDKDLRKMETWLVSLQNLVKADQRAKGHAQIVDIAPGLIDLAGEIQNYVRAQLGGVVGLLKRWSQDVLELKGDPSEEYAAWLLDGGGGVLEPTDDPLILRVQEDAPTAVVFLDEFQDLPLDVQALLMRLLEQGEMEPLGFNGKIRLVDARDRLHIRVIGASNSPRVRGIAAGDDRGGQHARSHSRAVRPDLVYRLAQWIVDLPKLDEGEVQEFVKRENLENNSRREEADEEAVEWQAGETGALNALQEAVKGKRLPGHRRQLRQVIKRAEALAEYDYDAGRVLQTGPRQVLSSHVQRALEGVHLAPSTERRDALAGDDESVVVKVNSRTPAGVAKTLASRLTAPEYLAKEFYEALGKLLNDDWVDLGIRLLRDQTEDPRKLTDAVASALFEHNGFDDKVLASAKTKKVWAWKNDSGRVKDKVYEAFALAARSWVEEVGRWPE